jgi:Protein of unknown function (DUF3617)
VQSPQSRGALRLVALGLAGGMSCVLYAQSLNLRPGNYEIVVTSQMQLPPEVAARLTPDMLARIQQPHTQQQCITSSDATAVSEKLAALRQREQDQNCKVSDKSITSGEVKMNIQCPNHTANVDIVYAGDSFKGTVQSLTQGQSSTSATIKIEAHRIGDCAK